MSRHFNRSCCIIVKLKYFEKLIKFKCKQTQSGRIGNVVDWCSESNGFAFSRLQS